MTEDSITSHQLLEIGKKVLPQNKFVEVTHLLKESYDETNLTHISEQLWKLVTYQIPTSDVNAKQLLDYVAYDLKSTLDPMRTRGICVAAMQSIESICNSLRRQTKSYEDHSFTYPSLGIVLKILLDENILDSDMIDIISKLNKYVWNPTKHVYRTNYSGRTHLFSIQDVILMLYIVTALTRKLIPYLTYDYGWECQDMKWGDLDKIKGTK